MSAPFLLNAVSSGRRPLDVQFRVIGRTIFVLFREVPRNRRPRRLDWGTALDRSNGMVGAALAKKASRNPGVESCFRDGESEPTIPFDGAPWIESKCW